MSNPKKKNTILEQMLTAPPVKHPAEMDNKYYTPSIEEFHVGFEYEALSGFMDGTVKTKEDFEKGNWYKDHVKVGSMPYIQRALNGRNAKKGLCGLRVKYLDSEDFIELGFDDPAGDGIFFKKRIHVDEEVHINFDTNILIERICATEDDSISTVFDGTIKSKSQLKQILQWTGIL